MKKTITITETAKALGLNRGTIYRYCKLGFLPAEQGGMRRDFRIKPEDLRVFAEKYNYVLDLPEAEG